MNVAIRVDASVQIGTGHVMRCLTLADTLRKHGANIHFICRSFEGHMGERIECSGYDVSLLPRAIGSVHQDIACGYCLGVPWEQDAKETICVVKEDIDWLVVDHYGIDFRWHNKLRLITNKIMVIDDLPDRRHDCDLLLNQTYGCERKAYRGLVPRSCRLLLGSQYALVHPVFAQNRLKALKKRKEFFKSKRLLVFMGGGDLDNVTGVILEGLKHIQYQEGLVVDVVLGRYAPHFKKVKNLAVGYPIQINLHSDITSSDMAELMVQADIAVGAGGTASWERCCLGLPTILLEVADNQRDVIDKLASSSSGIALGKVSDLTEYKLLDAITNILSDYDLCGKVGINAATLCDGLGIYRVHRQMFPKRLRNGAPVYLQPATMGDVKVMFDFQTEDSVRKFSRNSDMPTWKEHTKWLETKLVDPGCIFNLIILDGKIAGVVRLDKFKNSENEYEISILVTPKKQGKGLALMGVQLVHEMMSGYTIVADIHHENIASQRLFVAAGYEQITERTYIWNNGEYA